MIYFLYGVDTYRSRAKACDIVAEFKKKTDSALNVLRIDADASPELIFDIGRTASLFAPKEIVIIERPSSLTGAPRTHVLGELPRWGSDRNLTVVFWDEDTSEKKDELLDAIKKESAKSQEFKPLASAAVLRWLDGEAKARRIAISAREQSLLVQHFGADLWALSNELEKAAAGWSLTESVRSEENVWSFTDVFLQHRRRSFPPLINLLEFGYEPIYLIGALASAVRTLAIVRHASTSSDFKGATRALHPYVVKKNTALAKVTSSERIQNLFSLLVRADVESKTGRLPQPLPLISLVLRAKDANTPV